MFQFLMNFFKKAADDARQRRSRRQKTGESDYEYTDLKQVRKEAQRQWEEQQRKKKKP